VGAPSQEPVAHDLFEQDRYCPSAQSLHADPEQVVVGVENPILRLARVQVIGQNQAYLIHATAKHHAQFEAMKEVRSCV
jgi:hypothetical protein